MSIKKDPNQRHYFQLTPFEDFTEIMHMQCNDKNAQPITVWEKGEDQSLSEQYRILEYYPNPKILRLTSIGKQYSKARGSPKAGKQVLLKIQIASKINYFTGGRLKFYPKDQTYTIEIQQDVYKSQQRGAIRVNGSPTLPIEFTIGKDVFSAYDLSVGGTSFIINESEQERFVKGRLFTECVLQFDGDTYNIPFAQVAGLYPMFQNETPIGKVKVGITFKGLSTKVEKDLNAKISSNLNIDDMERAFDIMMAKQFEEN